MMRIIVISVLLYAFSWSSALAQTGSINDTIPSWHIGLDGAKLFQSLRNQLKRPDKDYPERITAFEVKTFWDRGRAFRPAFRMGYGNYHKTRGEDAYRHSQGFYGKAGLEYVFGRRGHANYSNHAIGLHGSMSRFWERNVFTTGNDYFGYRPVVHEEKRWMPAVELSYAYSMQIMPRFNAQVEMYGFLYDSNVKEGWRFYKVPGMPRAVGLSLHFFYQLYL